MKFVPSASPSIAVDQPAESRAWFVVHPKGLVVHQDGARVTLPNDADIASLALDRASAHRLGSLDDADAFAIAHDGAVDAPLTVIGLRGLADAFDDVTFAVAGRASHVIDWANSSRFCGRCGTAAERVAHERCMKCPACGLTMYPRIAPAIIVLVRRGDEALLARSARFPAAFYSTLAGFCEIGESLEDTLAREVFEEVGVRVKSVRYFGSQPWPFPNSLMLGFTAEWDSGEINIDGEEIVDAKWFRADELPMVPPPISIARRLIDAWVQDVNEKRRA